jgi:glutamate/tyrosine decarboxylase-like PLP-dependent enzyme
MANLEALWVAGRLHPGMTIAASEQAHYTHGRISEVLGLPFQEVPCTASAAMDPAALADMLEKGDIGTVVATVGTTGTGSVDPIDEILALRAKYDFRLHVDAAYGGYYILADNLSAEVRGMFDLLHEADSLVIDPHKHGLQPYGCGCVLFKDPAVGGFYKHDSPYTYFSSPELHLGEISLECSRAGAAAVALWATQKLLPMEREGAFARGLEKCRSAAVALHERLSRDDRFFTFIEPDLDIVVWGPWGDRISSISDRSRRLFRATAERGLHLALFSFPVRLLGGCTEDVEPDEEQLLCLRSCLMKPEHLDWIERIWHILDETVDSI